MRLIDAEELELDTEWSDYYDGFTSYSQSQINEAEEVKAIPLEKINKAIEEMKALADHKNTILDFNEKMGIKTAMNILVRSIREGVQNLSEKPTGSESEEE